LQDLVALAVPLCQQAERSAPRTGPGRRPDIADWLLATLIFIALLCRKKTKEVWHFNAQERYGKFNTQFGMHSTPVLDGDQLYMQLIHSSGAQVIALDKNTGECQIMNPLCLVPNFQEALLFLPPTARGRDPIILADLMPLAASLDWRKQRRLWRKLQPA
jgi:hypothetical protein